MLIFVEHIFLSLPSRLVTFLGSLLLSAVGPGIDYFQLLLLIEVFVGLLQLVTVWVWGFLFWVEFDFFFFPPSSLRIFMQFSSMSGTQILDLYFLLSSTDNIFPCVKEHFWYFRCMYIIWCSLLAYTTKIPHFKVCPQSKSVMAESLVSQRFLGVLASSCRGSVRILPGEEH